MRMFGGLRRVAAWRSAVTVSGSVTVVNVVGFTGRPLCLGDGPAADNCTAIPPIHNKDDIRVAFQLCVVMGSGIQVSN